MTAVIALWSGSERDRLADGFVQPGVRRAREPPLSPETNGDARAYLAPDAAINLAFVLLIYGQRIGHWVVDRWGVGSQFDRSWGIARWPIAVGSMMVMLADAYLHRAECCNCRSGGFIPFDSGDLSVVSRGRQGLVST